MPYRAKAVMPYKAKIVKKVLVVIKMPPSVRAKKIKVI